MSLFLIAATISVATAQWGPTRLENHCDVPMQEDLLFNVSHDWDWVCCQNADYAEYKGYLMTVRFFEQLDPNAITVFYDSTCGKPLYAAPIGRSFEEWREESESSGWPSFRDAETFWENVVALGPEDKLEVVSTCGTHLGHDLPDDDGTPRYCINLACMAGSPAEGEEVASGFDFGSLIAHPLAPSTPEPTNVERMSYPSYRNLCKLVGKNQERCGQYGCKFKRGKCKPQKKTKFACSKTTDQFFCDFKGPEGCKWNEKRELCRGGKVAWE